jgi:DNA-binding transcriptional LysR family regulator
MRRRYGNENIPIELLRSFIAVDDLGSFTKAAAVLHLTQPAISSQVRRLEVILGGSVFQRKGAGNVLTERGHKAARFARKILSLNDQILSATGAETSFLPLRIGISPIYGGKILSTLLKRTNELQKKLTVSCEMSADLTKSLMSGYIDVAITVARNTLDAKCVREWPEQLEWICSPGLLLSPGTTIPLVSWPNSMIDSMISEALQNSDLGTRITFTGSDVSALISAVRAGMGYFALPSWCMPEDLKIARERYLPPLPSFNAGIYLREEIELEEVAPILEIMESLLVPSVREVSQPAVLKKGA